MATEGWSAAAFERSRYCVQWTEVEAGDMGKQGAMMRGCGNSGDDGKALDAGCVVAGDEMGTKGEVEQGWQIRKKGRSERK